MKIRTVIVSLVLALSVVPARAATIRALLPAADFSLPGTIGTFRYSLPAGSVITQLTLFGPHYSFPAATNWFGLEFDFDGMAASSLPIWPPTTEFFTGSDFTHMVPRITWDGSLDLSIRCWTGGCPSTYTLVSGDCWILVIDFEPRRADFSKIRFVTETGDTITTGNKVMSHYFMSGEDGTLNIIVWEPLGFVRTSPDIGVHSTPDGNCTLQGDGSVTANEGQTFSFRVGSLTPGATLSAIYLPLNSGGFPATFDPLSGVFQWLTNANDVGQYLAEFQAEVGGIISRTVVLIDIVP